MPQPAPDLVPELALDFLLFPEYEARVVGYVDLWSAQRRAIWDYKTTSSIHRYSKSEEVLLTDPQALIYGMGGRLLVQEKEGVLPENIDLTWVYVQTKSSKTKAPEVKPVRVKQTLKILEDGLEGMRPTVKEMADLWQVRDGGVRLEEIPYKSEACWKYGGCPYRDLCPSFQKQRATSAQNQTPEEPMTQARLDLLAKLSAQLATQRPPEPPQEPVLTRIAPPPPPAPATEPEPMPFMVSESATATSPVLPPDAAPDVSPTDPPPPPEKTPRGRGRPKKATAPEEVVPLEEPEAEPEGEGSAPGIIEALRKAALLSIQANRFDLAASICTTIYHHLPYKED
jgi:hypothetical protein